EVIDTEHIKRMTSHRLPAVRDVTWIGHVVIVSHIHAERIERTFSDGSELTTTFYNCAIAFSHTVDNGNDILFGERYRIWIKRAISSSLSHDISCVKVKDVHELRSIIQHFARLELTTLCTLSPSDILASVERISNAI